MAAPLVPLSQQIPGGNPLYESYYKQVDPAYTGRVGASEAALFLKKSGLSDIILGKIWDLADPEGKGFLDKQGFYVALRLVACAQSGHEVTLSSLSLKMRFDEIFLKTDLDLDGYVSGQEVKEIFMHSGLTQNLLAHIWALADTRQTGKLSKEQFALAMYFIQQKVSKGIDPPQVLSPDMVPPSERGTPIPDSSSTLASGEFTGVSSW